MAMKKKFLGLAMAAAIALPASSAYAANNTLTGNSNDKLKQSVTVTGVVNKNDNASPNGTLTVELPTTLSFTVDKDGVFSGAQYQVTNKSSESITVAVAEFSETDYSTTSGIQLQSTTKSSDEMQSLGRNNIQLALVGDNKAYVDLSDQSDVKSKKTLLTVAGNNSTGTIHLLGEAGKNKTGYAETAGASETFNLVFEIKKA